MNKDMKALMDKAEELGYTTVRYDELEKTVDEEIKHRYMIILEEKKK
jgi:hypothetical protein